MNLIHSRLFVLALVSLTSICLLPLASAQNWNYPNARKSDQVDDYHGLQVADPYRWLEDDNSAETGAWVRAENEQALASHDNPVLIRIETKSGHGASSTTKAIEITGDVYSFIFYNLGV